MHMKTRLNADKIYVHSFFNELFIAFCNIGQNLQNILWHLFLTYQLLD